MRSKVRRTDLPSPRDHRSSERPDAGQRVRGRQIGTRCCQSGPRLLPRRRHRATGQTRRIRPDRKTEWSVGRMGGKSKCTAAHHFMESPVRTVKLLVGPESGSVACFVNVTSSKRSKTEVAPPSSGRWPMVTPSHLFTTSLPSTMDASESSTPSCWMGEPLVSTAPFCQSYRAKSINSPRAEPADATTMAINKTLQVLMVLASLDAHRRRLEAGDCCGATAGGGARQRQRPSFSCSVPIPKSIVILT